MRSIAGTMTGSSIDAEDALAFSSLQGIRPMIETVPLANAAEAYGRMMRNEARFRIVLVTLQPRLSFDSDSRVAGGRCWRYFVLGMNFDYNQYFERHRETCAGELGV